MSGSEITYHKLMDVVEDEWLGIRLAIHYDYVDPTHILRYDASFPGVTRQTDHFTYIDLSTLRENDYILSNGSGQLAACMKDGELFVVTCNRETGDLYLYSYDMKCG